MNEMQNLLNQVSIISKKNAEMLDATGGRFNMFRVCGVNHYEDTHSAILAELLNPQGSHGLKTKFLECFVAMMKVRDFSCENARIHTQYDTGNGRLDILIEEDAKKRALIIENKIYAGDQQEQLKRYNSFAENKYGIGNYQMFYLTLWGDKASTQSGGGVNYTPISYKDNVSGWLEKCLEFTVRFPLVRETVIQYINHLKQLTNQDMDTKNKQELTNIVLESSESLDSY